MRHATFGQRVWTDILAREILKVDQITMPSLKNDLHSVAIRPLSWGRLWFTAWCLPSPEVHCYFLNNPSLHTNTSTQLYRLRHTKNLATPPAFTIRFSYKPLPHSYCPLTFHRFVWGLLWLFEMVYSFSSASSNLSVKNQRKKKAIDKITRMTRLESFTPSLPEKYQRRAWWTIVLVGI